MNVSGGCISSCHHNDDDDAAAAMFWQGLCIGGRCRADPASTSKYVPRNRLYSPRAKCRQLYYARKDVNPSIEDVLLSLLSLWPALICEFKFLFSHYFIRNWRRMTILQINSPFIWVLNNLCYPLVGSVRPRVRLERGVRCTHTHPHTITGGPAKGFGDHYVRHHPEKSNQFEASLLGGEKKGKSGRWWCKFIVGDCC